MLYFVPSRLIVSLTLTSANRTSSLIALNWISISGDHHELSRYGNREILNWLIFELWKVNEFRSVNCTVIHWKSRGREESSKILSISSSPLLQTIQSFLFVDPQDSLITFTLNAQSLAINKNCKDINYNVLQLYSIGDVTTNKWDYLQTRLIHFIVHLLSILMNRCIFTRTAGHINERLRRYHSLKIMRL